MQSQPSIPACRLSRSPWQLEWWSRQSAQERHWRASRSGESQLPAHYRNASRTASSALPGCSAMCRSGHDCRPGWTRSRRQPGTTPTARRWLDGVDDATTHRIVRRDHRGRVPRDVASWWSDVGLPPSTFRGVEAAARLDRESLRCPSVCCSLAPQLLILTNLLLSVSLIDLRK